ncbi:MAG: hypothetical protein MK202_17020 [Tenacibaculum sp.]|nr:hypothetical protein [Tenacibaculum sp.]
MELKKLIIVFTLFFSGFVNAQEYGVWYSSRDYYTIPRSSGSLSHAYVNRVFNVEEREQILTLPGGGTISLGFITETTESGVHRADNSLEPFKLHPRINGETQEGIVEGFYFDEEKDLIPYEHYLGGKTYPSTKLFAINTSNKVEDMDEFHFYSIVLPYYQFPTDNTRSTIDLLFKSPINSFTDPIVKIPEIIWKYSYDNGSFKDFPADIKHDFPMKSTVGEILVNESVEFNKILRVKAELNNSNLNIHGTIHIGPQEYLPVIGTEIFTFNIISNSPEFKSVTTKSISCNGYEDGSLELKVGRDLEPNEKLAVTLFKEDITSGDFTIIPTGGQKLNITSLVNNGDGTYSYNWPEELPAGNYRMKYQTVNIATNVSPGSFDLLVFVGDIITIDSVDPVNFAIDTISDENCFNEKDGYIEVSAFREGSRTLLYQLSNNGIVQIFNGTNWVNYTGSDPENETYYPFTNDDKTIINKLGKGIYRVKVRDAQKCYMKMNN